MEGKLDKILARKALKAFTQNVMSAFVDGIQMQSIPVCSAEKFDDAVMMFVPQAMRFAGRRSSELFNAFMENAANLNHDAPNAFKHSLNPNFYTSRAPLGMEMHPASMAQLEKLTALAIATYKSWVAFFEFVRDKWPELIVDLHDETVSKPEVR